MQINVNDAGSEVHAEMGDRLLDCSPDEVISLLRAQGSVLFCGFQPDLGEYEVFTDQFGSCAATREVHYPLGGEGLGFHAEDAYNPYRPDAVWFFCAFEGSDGGVPTGVCDGVDLFGAMPGAWQSFCRTTNMRFDRQWAAATWQSEPAVTSREVLTDALAAIPGVDYQFLADDSLYIGYQAPLVVRAGDGRESFANSLLQAVSDHQFYGMTLDGGAPVPDELLALARQLAEELEHPLGWRTGEIAVIDNHRMMHRRGQYVQHDRDLRPRHCEDLFGSVLPPASTALTAWTKSLIQGDEDLPTGVGVPAAGDRNDYGPASDADVKIGSHLLVDPCSAISAAPERTSPYVDN